MPLKAGDTFFMANTGGAANPAGAYLMVCLVAPTLEGKAVIVPIVTRRDYSDPSYVLKAGDHPFIRHESCASYDFARVVAMADLEADIASREIVLKKPASKRLLERLRIGFVSSDEVEPWIYEAAHGDKLKLWLQHKGAI